MAVYTTKQVIALYKEYEEYKHDWYEKYSTRLMKGNFSLEMSFEHWLLHREEEKKVKPDARNEGNSGRKPSPKLDRTESIDKTYFNIKGEQVVITEYLPGVTRWRDNRRRMYSPTGQSYYMGVRLPKDNDLIIQS